MNKIKVIIADDHKLFSDGLSFILKETGNFEIIAKAYNGKELIKILESHHPHIIIMDINMPEMNGIEASKIILKNSPNSKILILSMFSELHYYEQLIEIGIKGFINKDANVDELSNAINTIINGDTYFSQELIISIFKDKKSKKVTLFSDREIEILKLICKGLSNAEISESLFLSERTIERHRANMIEKTNSKNSISLVIYAIKNELVNL